MYPRTRTVVNGTEFNVSSNYRIIKPIGSGAYGTVVSAEDTSTGQRVAIKKVGDAYRDLVDAKRILRELKLMRFFGQHENVVALHDLQGECMGEDVYIITELMETDVHRVVYSKQKLSDDHCAYFLYQILRGLKFMHSANVIHRDLKPSNLLVNSNCDLRICDLGLARGIGESDARLTEYVVTRWYRAPEVMLAAAYGKAADMWSVGTIFAELLRRKPLFPGADYLDQLRLIIGTLGTPSDEETRFVRSERAKAFLAKQAGKPKVPWASVVKRANPLAIDLLDKMLQFDPSKRVTVEQALAHPYLSQLHCPEDEPTHARLFDFSFELSLGKLEKATLQRHMYAEIDGFRRERAARAAAGSVPRPVAADSAAAEAAGAAKKPDAAASAAGGAGSGASAAASGGASTAATAGSVPLPSGSSIPQAATATGHPVPTVGASAKVAPAPAPAPAAASAMPVDSPSAATAPIAGTVVAAATGAALPLAGYSNGALFPTAAAATAAAATAAAAAASSSSASSAGSGCAADATHTGPRSSRAHAPSRAKSRGSGSGSSGGDQAHATAASSSAASCGSGAGVHHAHPHSHASGGAAAGSSSGGSSSHHGSGAACDDGEEEVHTDTPLTGRREEDGSPVLLGVTKSALSRGRSAPAFPVTQSTAAGAAAGAGPSVPGPGQGSGGWHSSRTGSVGVGPSAAALAACGAAPGHVRKTSSTSALLPPVRGASSGSGGAAIHRDNPLGSPPPANPRRLVSGGAGAAASHGSGASTGTAGGTGAGAAAGTSAPPASSSSTTTLPPIAGAGVATGSASASASGSSGVVANAPPPAAVQAHSGGLRSLFGLLPRR